MISKNKIKFLNSLKVKKNRDKNNLFIIEGTKIFYELTSQKKYKISEIYCTENWLLKNKTTLNYYVISESELKKISNQVNPEGVLAVVNKSNKKYNEKFILENFSLVLDDIQDPGNLGTIVRTADWFGIENIFCSKNSVDVFNPKVVQSTKGAIFRVNVFYVDLVEFLNKFNNKLKIYSAFLDGENIYKLKFDNKGLLILGNESNGISNKINNFNINKIMIPNLSKKSQKTESLNLSVSASIFLSEIFRNS